MKTALLTKFGNPSKDQFVVETEAGTTQFLSYNTLVAEKANGKVYLSDRYWNYSATTGNYRNQFLGEGIAETRKKIDSGEYTLVTVTSSTAPSLVDIHEAA